MGEARGASAKSFDIEYTARDLRSSMIESVLSRLEQRLGGGLYAKQRLGIETDHEAQIFGQGLTLILSARSLA